MVYNLSIKPLQLGERDHFPIKYQTGTFWCLDVRFLLHGSGVQHLSRHEDVHTSIGQVYSNCLTLVLNRFRVLTFGLIFNGKELKYQEIMLTALFFSDGRTSI